MQPAFECARYKNGNEITNVYCDEVTPENYKSKYRGHLYCPNSDCPADIQYVSQSSTGKRAFFRCVCLESHIPGCAYKKFNARKRVDIELKDIRKYFGEDQIQKALSSQFQKHFLYAESDPLYPPVPPGPYPGVTTRFNIKYYSASDIHDAVIRKIAIVGGYVRNCDRGPYREDNKHAYVNLICSEQVSVPLSEKIDAYPGEAQGLIARIAEMDNTRRDGLDIACLAFGEVVFARNGKGIRIMLSSLKHLICKYVPKPRR